MPRNRTAKVKSVKGKAGKVVAKKVHPLILDYLKSKGIPVHAVEVASDGESVTIYNKSLEESK
jgi:outer membrane lipoprotein-sorting protein